jgi:hypothetical protein
MDVGDGQRRVPFAELGPGRVQIEFGRLADVTDTEFDAMLQPVAPDQDAAIRLGDEFDPAGNDNADDDTLEEPL